VFLKILRFLSFQTCQRMKPGINYQIRFKRGERNG
jgi:hypothetical protein